MTKNYTLPSNSLFTDASGNYQPDSCYRFAEILEDGTLNIITSMSILYLVNYKFRKGQDLENYKGLMGTKPDTYGLEANMSRHITIGDFVEYAHNLDVFRGKVNIEEYALPLDTLELPACASNFGCNVYKTDIDTPWISVDMLKLIAKCSPKGSKIIFKCARNGSRLQRSGGMYFSTSYMIQVESENISGLVCSASLAIDYQPPQIKVGDVVRLTENNVLAVIVSNKFNEYGKLALRILGRDGELGTAGDIWQVSPEKIAGKVDIKIGLVKCQRCQHQYKHIIDDADYHTGYMTVCHCPTCDMQNREIWRCVKIKNISYTEQAEKESAKLERATLEKTDVSVKNCVVLMKCRECDSVSVKHGNLNKFNDGTMVSQCAQCGHINNQAYHNYGFKLMAEAEIQGIEETPPTEGHLMNMFQFMKRNYLKVSHPWHIIKSIMIDEYPNYETLIKPYKDAYHLFIKPESHQVKNKPHQDAHIITDKELLDKYDEAISLIKSVLYYGDSCQVVAKEASPLNRISDGLYGECWDFYDLYGKYLHENLIGKSAKTLAYTRKSHREEFGYINEIINQVKMAILLVSSEDIRGK